MRKKEVIILMLSIQLSILLCISCLGAADQYAHKAQKQSQQIHERQDQLAFLEEKIDVEQLELIEVGVELSGIVYDEHLEARDIENKIEQMKSVLESGTMYAKVDEIQEANLLKNNTYQKTNQQVTVEKNSKDWRYLFTLKNQKDIHENTYYHLKIVGESDVKVLDQLRNKGYAQLQAWHVTPKETIYFKGVLSGSLSQEENRNIKDRLFESLEVKATNSYQDDLIETTCAYYGYTPYIKDTIVEADGQKSNVQVGFKYDELQDQTEIMIAFPFYNQPF